MKGNEEVIKCLNEALFLELAAVNQYWLHYRLLEDWGLAHLAAKEREESVEEMHHADRLVARIIFLEGHPNLQTLAGLQIGENVEEILKSDLAAEFNTLDAYRRSRDTCEKERDYVSKNLFEELIQDEESHVDYLETQLSLLGQIGIQNYIQLQSGGADQSSD